MPVIATQPENAFLKEILIIFFKSFFYLQLWVAVLKTVSSRQETAGALAVQQNVQEALMSGDSLFLLN